MNRRDALKHTTIILGYTLAASTSTALISGCHAEPRNEFIADSLSHDLLLIVKKFADRILPATDTPGAIDAGVHVFIDQTITHFFTAEEKSNFIAGLKEIDDMAMKKYQMQFVKLSNTKTDDMIYKLSKDPKSIFKIMKELTVAGFFSSEVGQMQVLNYNNNPGPYQGCTPYSAGTPISTTHTTGW